MSEGHAEDFRDLVRGATRGDARARDELVARFYPRVQAIVHRQLQADFRQRHRWMLPLFSTRDVVQDVFTQVAASLGETDVDFPDEAAFVAYLSTVVRNRLLDAVRFHEAGKRDARRRVEPDTDESDAPGREPTARDTTAPPLAAALAEQAAALQEVLDTFPERHRLLLTLRIVEEEPFPAIATRLGYASAETARQAFLDAHAKLLVRLRARGVRPPGETLA